MPLPGWAPLRSGEVKTGWQAKYVETGRAKFGYEVEWHSERFTMLIMLYNNGAGNCSGTKL